MHRPVHIDSFSTPTKTICSGIMLASYQKVRSALSSVVIIFYVKALSVFTATP